ncbi:DUF2236 domain-containing protein [Cyclobacterium sp. 1_MG-2023]|uniref:oxygenase MpaB family protein n=1 Tax=Cyclobacterium sp. 1_MG-2023 TaxID=3062681 RepID=UPI0026E42F81|nr:DUF2236 domain-containing protein [Cyclobacterium sp. 1_MG-2023]MDO6436694.1 DUF2236 domain-containing protein [Cyclobacterium sp. 1_MG-2023]
MAIKPFTHQIEELDPAKDCEKICYLLTFHCFPWDMEKALEFALFRTFAVPSVSRLLVATGEFIKHTRKRYDDTELLLYEILENGMDSERGTMAIDRINNMHGRYKIANRDYLYVLSTFIFEPIRWMDKWGWRPFSLAEKNAILNNYLKLGERMHINDIPQTLAAFEAFNMAYEQEHFMFHKANAMVGNKTLDLLLGFYLPNWLFPLGRPVALCLMDAPLRKAMGYNKPADWLIKMVQQGMLIRGKLLKWLPERKSPILGTARKRKTYPTGYKVEELGTFR